MNPMRALDHLPRVCDRPLVDAESEIREELQFHLEMRTLDNISEGMTPEDALHDAHARFGDFEHKYQACRTISLGYSIALRRMQGLLLLVLVTLVVYLTTALIRERADHESSLQSLKDRIQSIQRAQSALDTAPANLIPCVVWNSSYMAATGTSETSEALEPNTWRRIDHSLEQPWCDWRSLDDLPVNELKIDLR